MVAGHLPVRACVRACVRRVRDCLRRECGAAMSVAMWGKLQGGGWKFEVHVGSVTCLARAKHGPNGTPLFRLLPHMFMTRSQFTDMLSPFPLRALIFTNRGQ
jgi:hypothetical protein